MPRVKQIIANKGPEVLSIGVEATVLDAVLLMNEHKVGALVVVEAGRIVGMFTERDLLRRVVGERLAPSSARVGEVMTREVICCRDDDDLESVRTIFMQRRIRHMPVMDGEGGPQGMISIGDLNAWQLDDQQVEIHYLHEYIHGRV